MLHSTSYVEGIRNGAIKNHNALYRGVSVGSQFSGGFLKSPSLLIRSKALMRSLNEMFSGYLCSLRFFLQSSDGEYHINCGSFGTEKNVTLDKFRSANTWKIFKATRPKSFLVMLRSEMPRQSLHSPLSPSLLNGITMFTSLMSCGTSPSIQHRQKIPQNLVKASPLRHFRISAGIPP